MGRCRDYDVCGLDDAGDPDARLCILHSRRSDKDPQAFARALAAHRAGKRDNFSRMLFPVPADFGGADFTTAFFNGTVFLEACDFSGATFGDMAFFQDAVFAAEATFAFASFEQSGSFARARFQGAAHFRGVTCQGPADFSGARFGGEADLAESHFAGAAKLTEAEFRGETSFRGAGFGGEADFAGATFQGRPCFRRVTFAAGVRFVRAELMAGADFQEAMFGGAGPDFSGARLGGETLFTARDDGGEPVPAFAGVPASFQAVRLAADGQVVFQEADLRRCRFLEIGARNLRFDRVLWPSVPGRGGRVAVYDELAPPEEAKPRSWARLERLYRELRRGAEAEGAPDRAGDFRYGELAMRRRNPETQPSVRRLLWLFELLSGYGERYPRVLAIAAGCWLGFAAAYLLLGLVAVTDGRTLELGRPGDWLRALHFSLGVMTLTPPWDLVATGVARGLQTLEQVMGPLLLALLGHSIVRRLRR
jgi:uncharacterized protein YjbI with pentapeptide repeats